MKRFISLVFIFMSFPAFGAGEDVNTKIPAYCKYAVLSGFGIGKSQEYKTTTDEKKKSELAKMLSSSERDLFDILGSLVTKQNKTRLAEIIDLAVIKGYSYGYTNNVLSKVVDALNDEASTQCSKDIKTNI